MNLISKTAILLVLLTASAHAQLLRTSPDGNTLNPAPIIRTTPYTPQGLQAPRTPSYGIVQPTLPSPYTQPRSSYGSTLRPTFPRPLDDDD
jgi:hypothetical protein